MITIISSTNRLESKTHKVAKETLLLLTLNTNKKVRLLDLTEISFENLNAPSYKSNSKYAHYIRDEFFIPAQQFIFIIPEYNGSFPGILKYFIDVISTVDFNTTFKNKTAALIGVSQGRAGNLRGLTHFASILMHMHITVMPQSLPLSMINDQWNEDGTLNDSTKKRIKTHLQTIG
jgi:NAD(P)H-dependent FMN reductase